MNLILRFIVFICVSSSVLFLIHFYFYRRLAIDTGLSVQWRRRIKWVFVVLAASMPLSMALKRALSFETGRLIVFLPYVWMGMMLFLFFFLLAVDLLIFVKYLIVKFTGSNRERKSTDRKISWRRKFAVTGIALTLLLASWSVYSASSHLEVIDVDVRLSRLPADLNGFTIVLISDVHVGSVHGGEWLSKVVDRVNSLKPDLVVITGDMVDGSMSSLLKEMKALSQLKAKHGVYMVTGNHEYYSGVMEWIPAIENMGIRFLRNERVHIGDEQAGFDLAGIDDYNAGGNAPGHGPDLVKALKGRDPEKEVILLAHQPVAVVEAEKMDVGLQLSGHTHGGQIFPWGLMVLIRNPYLSGLHRHGRRTQIYVTQGAGVWGPPMRLGSTMEISHIRLLSD